MLNTNGNSKCEESEFVGQNPEWKFVEFASKLIPLHRMFVDVEKKFYEDARKSSNNV